ncbi:fumarate/nitrate reduction transcriptional regulator Fnr [Microbulbifer hydrolyticus]|uniref:Fumarate/nitrate reduction transcriptional regulator Fnr n=2 Tax=Microbulbifer hydrolyticus TaxID=48074 RepID=A0ABX6IWV6_9GAMM|nr:fumarate/nitrate reduction transcriptional regulator Fnr [Microbulbifer hydrolyticus]QHQ38152.1 fumarate/nitrate reduction transcriptional regulator Fnr [Microbulbifer hydrolyticus]
MEKTMSKPSPAVNCGNCSVRRLCLPVGLSEDDIQRLEQVTRKKKILKAGDSLFRAGDPFSSLYAIRSGSFKSAVIGADGDTQVTHFALPGELLGLDAYSSGAHPGYAEALEDSSVCVLPFTQLENLAQQVPALQKQMYTIFSEELKQDNDVLLLLGKRSAESRLAALLINISSRYAQRGYSASEFKLSMQRIDIANYLGLTAETVSRLMSRFQKQGLIRAQGRAVAILDLIALSELAGTHCSYEND